MKGTTNLLNVSVLFQCNLNRLALHNRNRETEAKKTGIYVRINTECIQSNSDILTAILVDG